MDTDELIGMNLEHYRVIGRLGEGGMAVVYRAQDLHLNRLVAIKVLRLYQVGLSEATQGFIKRFEREAQALARLQHPNIVPIIDFGAAGERFPYLVMPLLTGGTLKEKIGSPMPYRLAAHLLAPMAGALAYAHRAGIIHRDVKPTNILLTESGEPMLSDFGIARFMQEESLSLTATGAFIGTPGYMAPEQWQGQVLPQTDIFSLGVVFYELVTGHNPYNADTPQEVLYRQLIAPLPDPRQYTPDLPLPVVDALQRALAKVPDERYPLMDDFATVLRQFDSPDRAIAQLRGEPEVAADRDAAHPPHAGPAEATALENPAAPEAPPPVEAGPHTVLEPPAPAVQSTRLDGGGPALDEAQTQVEPFAAAPTGGWSQPVIAAAEQPPVARRWGKWIWPLSGAGLILLVAGAWFLLGGPFKPSVPVTAKVVNQQPTTVLGTAIQATGTPPPVPTSSLARPTATSLPPTQTLAVVPVPPAATSLPSPTPRAVKNTVLWDSSHGPRIGHEDGVYDPTQLYSQLVDLLAKNGLSLQNNQQPLAGLDLSAYGVVVINEWSAEKQPYTAAEVDLLEQYVRQGGGLLILAEQSQSLKHVAPVASRFGITVAQAPDLNGALLSPGHPITQGVSALDFLYPGGTLQASGNAQVIGALNGHPAVVVLEQGAGRVVVIGDANLFDNRCLKLKDNTPFAVNVFHWLTGAP